MGRMVRAFRDKSSTLLQLDKMKNQAEHSLIIQTPTKDTDLGLSDGTTALFMRRGPLDLPSILLGKLDQVYEAITVMATGWVLLGTPQRLSKKKVGLDGRP